MTTEVETGRFTIGVFQDVAWAERGIEALKRQGFEPESLSIAAVDSPETAALAARALGVDGAVLEVRHLGSLRMCGSLVDALQGQDEGLGRMGMAATMRRIGFQTHDGHIFETLTARGGILVAIRSEPRAADALAILHAYGGGNAAIGAWTGRV